MVEGFRVGDAADLAAVGVEERSVQTIVTSPPYWKARDYGHGDDQLGFEDRIADYIKTMGELFDGFHRFLRKDGTVWVVIGDSYNTRTKVRFSAHNPGLGHGDELTRDTNTLSWAEMSATKRVKHSARTGKPFKEKDLVPVSALLAQEMLEHGWWYRADIIWNKPFGKPENVKDRPLLRHEHVLLFSAVEKPYTFHRTEETQYSVWTINPGAGIDGLRGPAVFPSELVRRCLEATTDPGDLVLDPFAGAGVAVHTARRMKRRAVGVDLSDEWWTESLSTPATPWEMAAARAHEQAKRVALVEEATRLAAVRKAARDAARPRSPEAPA